MTYTVRNDVVVHKYFKTAVSKLERVHQRSKANGFAEGLFLTGPSGTGKTTLINYYVEKHHGVEEADRTTVPILVVETPSAPTAKNLAETIQIALTGDIAKGTTEFQTNRIYTLLKELRVELLIIDEIQHFVDRKRIAETARVTDWLKSFINKAQIPVVLIGLPRSLQMLELNEQLRRRFSARCFIRPFGFNDSIQQRGFRAVLKVLEAGLPYKCEASMFGFPMARRFHYASNGLFDYMAKIIDGAVEITEGNESDVITLAAFEQAFLDTVWNDAPSELNPFSRTFIYRRLDKFGEPFYCPDVDGQKAAA
ncbi:bacterial TniB protein [mine drainage metagenome]|uniref:Bacterial TniB protein n=1 Tax=mine drainage metagenome TaxID=410659 RepID=A0A1J5RM96_9ZZZZ